MPFFMIRNDITKVQVDAVVNPANQKLLEGSGTSKAIYEAAGEQCLREACRQIGSCALGKAVITDAFRLDAKYIIHAVGPVWQDGNSGEAEMLYRAYAESLKLAHIHQCESIAFPLLSSGHYGYPKDKAMKVAVLAISDFLMEHDMLVYMVLYDRDSVSISQKLFESIDEYIDDNYVEENDEVLKVEEQTVHFPYGNYAARGEKSIGLQESYRDERKIRNKKSRFLDSVMDHMDETFSQMLLRLI